ncbi:MAG: ATP-binding cassette domain-containing protein [Christensenellales bacterium]|nr:ATP-binding cassette domain-containing protein [Christensenellales bacterium]
MGIIEAKGIFHSYNGKDTVLNGVDLSVEKGEFLSVLGASGSGKTTLLSVLGGIERPTEGHVFVDGEDITECGERRRAVLRRSKIGFVFQFFNLAPYLTVEQNILVPVLLGGKGKKSVGKDLDALLELVGLADKRSSLPGKLSGGEQQRVAIARGLISRP